jgi:hypothetical protein
MVAGPIAALAVVLVAALALVAWPRSQAAGPSPTPAGHFDNGLFGFDIPASWRLIATNDGNDTPILGTGDWVANCPTDPIPTDCYDRTADVSGGRIVVTMSIGGEGAPGYCSSAAGLGTAPLGSGWIRRYDQDPRFYPTPTIHWEIRRPGYDFGMTGNLWLEAVSSNSAAMAGVDRLLDTFNWDSRADLCGSPSPAPVLPGRAGHYDDGGFSFDYPATWRVFAKEYYEGMAFYTAAVIGTGDWHSGCRTVDNGGECTGDVVDVSGGRVVVKLYERVGGPANLCGQATAANATLGPNAVLKSQDGHTTTWEVRMPGAEFSWANNIQVIAWTSDDAGTAQVEALVASFRWASSVSNAGNCAPIETPMDSDYGPRPELAIRRR